MKYEELISKLKEIYKHVDQFTEEGPDIPDDFKFSEKIEKIAANKEQALINLKAHPFYNDKKVSKEGHEELNRIYQDLPSVWDAKQEEYLDSIGIGRIEEVSQRGGEGEGEYWESVKYFPMHDIYIKVVGHYTSYEGTEFYNEWDCCSQVVPVKKEVTYYE